MSVQTDGMRRGGFAGVVRLLEAMSERERADAEVRKATVDLVQWDGDPDLQEAATLTWRRPSEWLAECRRADSSQRLRKPTQPGPVQVITRSRAPRLWAVTSGTISTIYPSVARF